MELNLKVNSVTSDDCFFHLVVHTSPGSGSTPHQQASFNVFMCENE